MFLAPHIGRSRGKKKKDPNWEKNQLLYLEVNIQLREQCTCNERNKMINNK